MRLYSLTHLDRIGLYTWAYQNLTPVYHEYNNTNSHYYVIPTPEAETLIEQHNILAALKGIKIVKPVYKNTYKDRCKNSNMMRWC